MFLIIGAGVRNLDRAVFPVRQGIAAGVFAPHRIVTPHVIGNEQARVFIEAARRGAGRGDIADVPFAEMGSGVTVLFECHRHDRKFRIKPRHAWADGVNHLRVMRITTRQQRRARGRANRLRHMKACIADTFGSEFCHMGSGIRRISEGVEIRVGRVIEEDQDDVRALCGAEVSAN